VGQDPQKELKDLAIVNAFYQALLEKNLGHGVPVPAEIVKATGNDQDPAEAILHTRNWLDLLDMAITPPMVRDFLKSTDGLDTAHSLLRYFVSKVSPRAGDRDKSDCIATYLFRRPPENSQLKWQRPETTEGFYFLSQAALAFEAQLYQVLGDVHFDSMPQEHVQLLHEFEYFHQELEEFRHFDQIVDSGIIQRVRELKQSLGKSFYHPDALANIAVWNDVFGRRFDELFHDATKQIKTFAEHVQKEGGSIMSRVDGDVTVKQLNDLQTNEIMAEDYHYAQDQFRKVSKFKKAVDSKRPARAHAPLPPREMPAAADPPPSTMNRPAIPSSGQVAGAPSAAPTAPATRAVPAAGAPAPKLQAEVLAVSPSIAVQNAVQEGKIHNAREMIRTHVRTADPKLAHVIPVKNGKIALTPTELEAFRAEYQGEKSFRADYANIVMTVVAYMARMTVEAEEYNQKANSAYLWKPHADALSYLLNGLERLSQEAEQVKAVARARGLSEKATALDGSLSRVRDFAKTVAHTLRSAEQSSRA